MTEDFIRAYEGVFDKEFCDDVIKSFDWAEGRGFTLSRQDFDKADKVNKKDTSLFAHDFDLNHSNKRLGDLFTRFFWDVAYAKYADEFSESLLSSSDAHQVFAMKVQKTNPSGGYHQWHYEASGRAVSNRLLAYTVYLNDVEEGGETEFLYQQKRIKPIQGTVSLFPASFTHLHRGNPPLSGAKYIITGWVEF
jgi:hypothetical protein